MPSGPGRSQQQQQQQQQQGYVGGRGGDPSFSGGFPRMRSLFDDPFFTRDPSEHPFFNRDPFHHPFFNQPFGASPLGGPTLGGGIFGGGLFGGSLFGPPMLPQLEQHPVFASDFMPRQQTAPPAARQAQLPPAPSVQEIDPAAEHFPGSSQEPIVEHPSDSEDEEEDDGRAREHGTGRGSHPPSGTRSTRAVGENSRQQQGQHQTLVTSDHPFPGLGSIFGGAGGASSSSFVFQSSYVSHSGIGGTQYYSASSSRRAGPGGVVEEQHTQRDSSGHESMRLSRGINEKGRTLNRVRRGREDTSEEILHNITPDEAKTFDENWQRHARGEFWEGRSTQPRLAQLPSNDEDHSGRRASRRRTPWS